MTEIPKLVGDTSNLSPVCFSSSAIGFGEMSNPQKIEISDDQDDDGSLRKTETSDSFVVDIESLSHGLDKDIAANSRISVKLQRNLSRKGSHRGERNKTSLPSGGGVGGGGGGGVADGSSNASMNGSSSPDKSTRVPLMGSKAKEEQPEASTESQQIITITTESRCRRSAKHRNSTWLMDPRRILFLFASLSSMGTIILIYFTLSMSKYSGIDNTHSQ